MAMDIEQARERCREYVQSGMLKHHAYDALHREGFDRTVIDQVLKEYESLRLVKLQRQTAGIRLWAGALFVGCGAAFAYYAFFAYEDRHVFHYWLLAPAMLGLLKMLLP